MKTINADLERRISAAMVDDEVQIYVQQLKDIYAYRPGEPVTSLAFRSVKARGVSAKLNALLQAKYQFGLNDLKEIYEQRHAHFAEVAASAET